MKVHYVIVLIKLCLDAGNDFSIILCNFGSLLVRGFKVIEVGLGSTRSPHPGPRRQKKASYEQRVKRAFLFLSHTMIVSVTVFLNLNFSLYLCVNFSSQYAVSSMQV